MWQATVEGAEARGLRVLRAAPAQSEAELAFSSLADLLGPALGDVVGELPPPQRSALEAALLLESPGGGRTDRRAVGAGLLNALRALAAEGPLLVAIDDVQWLDRSSAAALQFAFRRLRDEPVALLLARRPGNADEGLEQALPAEQVLRVEIGPLDFLAMNRVVQDRLGTVLVPAAPAPRPRALGRQPVLRARARPRAGDARRQGAAADARGPRSRPPAGASGGDPARPGRGRGRGEADVRARRRGRERGRSRRGGGRRVRRDRSRQRALPPPAARLGRLRIRGSGSPPGGSPAAGGGRARPRRARLPPRRGGDRARRAGRRGPRQGRPSRPRPRRSGRRRPPEPGGRGADPARARGEQAPPDRRGGLLPLRVGRQPARSRAPRGGSRAARARRRPRGRPHPPGLRALVLRRPGRRDRSLPAGGRGGGR